MPPRADSGLDPEEDPGIYLDDWRAVESSLLYIDDLINMTEIEEKEKTAVLRGVLSPDPRERFACCRIAEKLIEKKQLEKQLLVSIAVEYLLDEVEHYGIDFVLMLINEIKVESEEISEIYIPLMRKRINDEIRLQIERGVVDRLECETPDLVFISLLKECRVFGVKNQLFTVDIIEKLLEKVEKITQESIVYLGKIFTILLLHECQIIVERILFFFGNARVYERIKGHSKVLVEELFDISYTLSQSYWKKTDRSLVCEILLVLFNLNKKVFDESLRLHNYKKTVEKENDR